MERVPSSLSEGALSLRKLRLPRGCRACKGQLVQILDLGEQHLSDFRTDDVKPPRFPLVLMECKTCSLVQLSVSTPRELMYHDRYGFKSGVSRTIRDDLADVVAKTLWWHPEPRSWLDIACNDGTLLSNVPESVYRVGVDPVRKYAAEARRHANLIVSDFFDPDVFAADGVVPQQFDVITSVSVFYDLDDPDGFVKGVASLLAKDGVWVVQQNYWLATVEQNAVDNICHEHLTYFTLKSMEPLLAKHGLRVFDVTTSGVNGGSFRTFICHEDARFETAAAVAAQRELELVLDEPSVYRDFKARTFLNLLSLKALVKDINRHGERVYIYGASTRGGTVWQGASLDVNDLPFAVERNPEKVGRKIASIGVPIISEEQARADMPEYMLVSIWFNRAEVIDREAEYLAAGGKLLFPMPELEVVG